MRRWVMWCACRALAGCGDNHPDQQDAAPADAPYLELATLPDYNHASETVLAASGQNVVVLAIDQRFPSADSFAYPAADDDPDHPFRRIAYVTSQDGGRTFSDPAPLFVPGHSDPVISVASSGVFWAAGIATADPSMLVTDLVRSDDGGSTFTPVVTVPIEDKPWIVVDDARRAVWIAGVPYFGLVGFDGGIRAAFVGSTMTTPGLGMTAGFAEDSGAHFVDDDAYQQFVWDGVGDPQHDGDPLPAGDVATESTKVSAATGRVPGGGQWIVRALRDSAVGSPIVVRVRFALDDGSDVAISTPGTIGFLPAAALDDEGRLHVVWYDSSEAAGRFVYARSLTSDLRGAYTAPVVLDDDACPGNGWYPYSAANPPPGGRRLREYVGIAVTRHRAFFSWTHAPDPPSRVRVAHLDF